MPTDSWAELFYGETFPETVVDWQHPFCMACITVLIVFDLFQHHHFIVALRNLKFPNIL